MTKPDTIEIEIKKLDRVRWLLVQAQTASLGSRVAARNLIIEALNAFNEATEPVWIEYNGDITTLPGWHPNAFAKAETRCGRSYEALDPWSWVWADSSIDILRYKIIRNG